MKISEESIQAALNDPEVAPYRVVIEPLLREWAKNGCPTRERSDKHRKG